MRIKTPDLVLGVVLVLSLALFIIPQVVFVRLSFYQNLGMAQVGNWSGIGNYAKVLTDGFTLGIIVKTVWLSALAALVSLLIGTPAAYWMTRLRSRWLGILIILLLISSFVSVVVKVLGLQILLGSSGIVVLAINALTFGLWQPTLLYNDFGVVIGMIQYTLPLMMLVIFGVFQNIPISLEEAALIHGATNLRMFRRILLPEALKGLLVAGLVAFNMNMGAFTSAALLGGGKVLTVPVLIQRMIAVDLDYPDAAALSVMLIALVLLINLQVGLLTRRGWGRGLAGAGQ
jgi:putative spermidine/putrescine transport system permease protein